ncbi:hypothetical protein [Anaerosinus massiliensis]|uniref:hypothetical protein n=1 Tax=Massilibacillus massiliensis TaxID=1806837 RepID=UPI000DA5FCB2|nr:hypothetical protein [Massilibacillus massiliensis]
MKIDAKNVNPEVVAVIATAVHEMVGNVGSLTISPVPKAVSFKVSSAWVMSGRQRLMNAY